MRGKAWKKDHDPFNRPLGCNGRYGNSGRGVHKNAGTPVCKRCKKSAAHYARERRRGGIKPRGLEPCGTWAAAARHRRYHQPLDLACSLAEAAKSQDYRDRKKAEHEPVPA